MINVLIKISFCWHQRNRFNPFIHFSSWFCCTVTHTHTHTPHRLCRFVRVRSFDPAFHSTSLHHSPHLYILHLSFSYLSCSVKLEYWPYCQSTSIFLHFFCCLFLCVSVSVYTCQFPISCCSDEELHCGSPGAQKYLYHASMHYVHYYIQYK